MLCFFVSATVQEAEAIVYHLYQNPEKPVNFQKNYPVWREKVKQGGDLFIKPAKTDHIFPKPPAGSQPVNYELGNLTAYAMQGIPCPFLINGACSIYEVRPFVCAGFVVTTPCEWCNAKSPGHIADRKVQSIPCSRRYHFIMEYQINRSALLCR